MISKGLLKTMYILLHLSTKQRFEFDADTLFKNS